MTSLCFTTETKKKYIRPLDETPKPPWIASWHRTPSHRGLCCISSQLFLFCTSTTPRASLFTANSLFDASNPSPPPPFFRTLQIFAGLLKPPFPFPPSPFPLSSRKTFTKENGVKRRCICEDWKGEPTCFNPSAVCSEGTGLNSVPSWDPGDPCWAEEVGADCFLADGDGDVPSRKSF